MVTKPSSMERLAPVAAPREAPGAARGHAEGVDPTEEWGYDVPQDERAAQGKGGGRSLPEGTGAATAVARRTATWRQRLRTTLEIVRANPTGRIALQVFVAVAGALVVAIGIVLIPLPGPGWLLVIGGLGIWAVEFHWARRLLAYTRRHVRSWTRWIGRQSWPIRLVAGGVGLVFVGVILVLSLKYSFGIDLIADLLRYLATH